MLNRYVNRTCVCVCMLVITICIPHTVNTQAEYLCESHVLVYRYLCVINAVSRLLVGCSIYTQAFKCLYTYLLEM